jgi:hypothetical protein
MNEGHVKIGIRLRPNKPSELTLAWMAPDGSVYHSEPVTLDDMDIKTAVDTALAKAQGRHEAALETANTRLSPARPSQVGK